MLLVQSDNYNFLWLSYFTIPNWKLKNSNIYCVYKFDYIYFNV